MLTGSISFTPKDTCAVAAYSPVSAGENRIGMATDCPEASSAGVYVELKGVVRPLIDGVKAFRPTFVTVMDCVRALPGNAFPKLMLFGETLAA